MRFRRGIDACRNRPRHFRWRLNGYRNCIGACGVNP